LVDEIQRTSPSLPETAGWTTFVEFDQCPAICLDTALPMFDSFATKAL